LGLCSPSLARETWYFIFGHWRYLYFLLGHKKRRCLYNSRRIEGDVAKYLILFWQYFVRAGHGSTASYMIILLLWLMSIWENILQCLFNSLYVCVLFLGSSGLEHITCLQLHSICQGSRFSLPLGSISFEETIY
jgi:hypothetical protein